MNQEEAKQFIVQSIKDGVSIVNIENAIKSLQEQEVGHWIQEEVRGSLENRCSVCDRAIDTTYFYNYCPNCGARMR